MSVHITNFGSFSDGLRPFADLNGQIPEASDEPGAFSWPHDDFTDDFDENGNGWEGYAAENWAQFVADAAKALDDAREALAEWNAA